MRFQMTGSEKQIGQQAAQEQPSRVAAQFAHTATQMARGGARITAPRINPPHAATTLRSCMMFPDRLLRSAIEHGGMETGLLKPFKGPQFSARAQVIANSLLA